MLVNFDAGVDKHGRSCAMPKIVDYDDKKHEIAEKAVHVFIEKGYHKTKLSNIARVCGMGRTTLYQYFRNKDAIFHYVVKQGVESYKAECRNLIDNNELSYLKKIEKIIEKLVKWQDYNNVMIIFIELWLLLRRERSKMEEELYVYVVELRQMFKSLLKEAIKAKEIKDVNLEAMSYTLFGLIESIALQRFWNKNINIEEHLKAVDMLIDGLRI